MQKFLLLLSAATLLFACKETTSPPNIVIILADDMGYGDVSYLNPKAGTQTPAIDRLGEEGMIFTDAHSPSAVCTPTRYGLLTGRYSFRTSLKSGVLVGHSPSLIETENITIAEMLKSGGYHTSVIGKWHLGLDWQKKNDSLPLWEEGNAWDIGNTENVDYSTHVGGGPDEHGFDHSFINPASLDIAPYVYLENGVVTAPIEEHIEGFNEIRGVFWRHGDRAADFELEGVLDRYGDEAVDYIDRRSGNGPFFLYLPLTSPHTPWLPGEDFTGSSQAGLYGDFVNHTDHIVGRVLEALDRNEQTENTIVIFSSDNGAHWTPNDKSQFEHRANAVFKGMKSDIWEGGHRVPFLARWPEKIKAGSRQDALIGLSDLWATMAELSGYEGNSTAIDSYSFYRQLIGEIGEVERPYLIHHSVNGQFAIRKGEWKLVDHPGSGGWSDNGKDAEYPQQLYNVKLDPGETTNLITDEPEIARELNEYLHALRNETGN